MKAGFFLVVFLVFSAVVFGQFGPEKPLSGNATQGISPECTLTADLDQDGDIDIVVSSANFNKVAWYENDGAGNFGYQKIISNTATNVQFIDVKDIDGDGKIDVLAAVNLLDKLVWYKNLGGGYFTNEIIISMSADNPVAIHGSDLDLDGDIDVISASNLDDEIAWYENIGGGVFGPQQIVSLLVDGAKSVYAADLNGDVFPEIISGSALDDKVAWYLNDGVGGFGPQQIVSTNANLVFNVSSGDLDFDGDNDIVSASFLDDKVAWYQNLGGGLFSTEIILSTTVNAARSAQCVDLDQDGDLDVLATADLDKAIVWFENNVGTFGPKQIIWSWPTSGGMSFASAGDFDGNGTADIASGPRLGCNLNLGGGVFGEFYDISGQTSSLQVIRSEDLDGDGHKDVIGTDNQKIVWYRNNGSGWFEPQKLIHSPSFAFDLTTADMDLDGDPDIVCADADSTYWLENNGSGNFINYHNIGLELLSEDFHGISIADLDNDGDPDLVAAITFGHQIAWYMNLGAGVFGPRITISYSVNVPESVTTFDFDSDGDIDVFSTSKSDDKIAMYINTGGGVFGAQQVLSLAADQPRSLGHFDLDQDGDDDLLVAAEAISQIAWLENLGTSFSPLNVISTNVQNAMSATAADIDNDGDLDIISASRTDDKIAWYDNLGGGVFGTQQIISLSSDYPVYVYADDLDFDNDIDLMACSQNDYKMTLFYNLLFNPNQATGTVFYDVDQNGIMDINDQGFNLTQVITNPANAYAYTYTNGYYFVQFNETTLDTFEISTMNMDYWSLTTDSSSYHLIVDSSFTSIDSLNFGYYPDTLFYDSNTEVVGGFPRCNTVANYWVYLANMGTLMPSGIVHVILDDSLNYVSSVITPDSINGQNIYFSFDSLFFFASELFTLEVEMPSALSIGDSLISYVFTTILDSLGNIASIETDSLKQFLVCAYDPNDKIAQPAGIDSMGYIPPSTAYLDYTIRFQNTGTDTAINVIIYDQLDPNLQWQTLTPLANSHNVQINVDAGGLITFSFNSIMLPDSNANFLASQGFIKYRIELQPNIPIGTSIYNSGSIYFDSNPPIITNTKIHTIYDCSQLIQNSTFPSLECQNEIIQGLIPDAFSTSDFVWEIIGVETISGFDFNWLADTSGIFNLKVSVSNEFCDKDTTIQFTVLPEIPIQMLSPIQICAGESTLIFGQLQSISGTYNSILQSVNGCDSILTIDLNILPSPAIQIIDTTFICDGDSLLIFGNYQTLNGLYYDSLQTVMGCDSVLAKQLNIISISINDLGIQEICTGDSLLIFGNYQSSSGIYYDSLQGNLGCDSIIMKQLIVNPPVPNTTLNTSQICVGDSLDIFGEFQTSSGIYYDTLQTTNGCDSILSKQLDVLPLPSVNFNALSQDTLCIYSGAITISATPAGGNYSGNGVSSNQFNPTIAGQGTHYIYYNYTDVNGCSATDSAKVFVDACLGVDEENTYKISIFPNPFHDFTTIYFGQELVGNHSVLIYDLLGQIAYSVDNVKGNQLEIKRNELKVGVYVFSLIDSETNQEVYTTKLIVE